MRASEGGAPVAGAIVSDGEMGGLGGGAAQTDADGRFRLGRLQPGLHKLAAVAAGHATAGAQRHGPPTDAAGA